MKKNKLKLTFSMKKITLTMLTFSFLITSCSRSEEVKRANEYYEKGDCKNAYNLFYQAKEEDMNDKDIKRFNECKGIIDQKIKEKQLAEEKRISRLTPEQRLEEEAQKYLNIRSADILSLKMIISNYPTTKVASEAKIILKKKIENAQSNGPLFRRNLEEKDFSFGNTKRISYRSLIEDINRIPSQKAFKITAQSDWSLSQENFTKKSMGFNPDRITIFYYLFGMDTNSTAYVACDIEKGKITRFDVNDFALSGTKWK